MIQQPTPKNLACEGLNVFSPREIVVLYMAFHTHRSNWDWKHALELRLKEPCGDELVSALIDAVVTDVLLAKDEPSWAVSDLVRALGDHAKYSRRAFDFLVEGCSARFWRRINAFCRNEYKELIYFYLARDFIICLPLSERPEVEDIIRVIKECSHLFELWYLVPFIEIAEYRFCWLKGQKLHINDWRMKMGKSSWIWRLETLQTCREHYGSSPLCPDLGSLKHFHKSPPNLMDGAEAEHHKHQGERI
ncbi:MAG: hypothetical protein JWM16_3529 [Verrucomicrobiales bacterium]|nr:hypothetical protein [Verrucomicrobiales bacterium]